jgi:hypothetical protein
MRNVLSAFILGGLLSGCMPLPISLGLSGFSYIVSGKGPADHVISQTVNRDCAAFRLIVGQEPCRAFTDNQQSHLWAALQVDGVNAENRTPPQDRPQQSSWPLIMPISASPMSSQGKRAEQIRVDAQWHPAMVSTVALQKKTQIVNRKMASGLIEAPAAERNPQVQIKPKPKPLRQVIKTLVERQPEGRVWQGFVAPSMMDHFAVPDISTAVIPVNLTAGDLATESWRAPVDITVRPKLRPTRASMATPGLAAYQVVVGSVQDRRMANRLASRFVSYGTYVVAVDIAGDQWHRVIIDAKTLDGAKSLRQQLGRIDGQNPWIRTKRSRQG